ncbi:MAG: DNA methyltransferase [Candidatus Aenigmatarchaeota archaeon]
MKFKDAPDFKFLVTFVPNKQEPIHNWYYYKEGFSKGLVDFFLSEFKVPKDSIVFDPFCGVGTTLLACKQRGIMSIGMDISPLTVFVSRVKTRDYSIEELEKVVKEALKWKFTKPKRLPQEKWLRKVFSIWALEDIMFYRKKIFEIEEEKARDFLLLGLIDSAMKCSFAYKDGALVRIKRRPVAPVAKMFKYKIRRMLKDLRKKPLPEVPVEVEIGDARNIELSDNSIDFVITSPPYMNKIEYTRIYKTEFSLFFNLPETKLRAYVGEGEDTEKAYFKDMSKVLDELFRTCRPGARIAMVVGGGCFPDRVVEADRLVAELAQEKGFSVPEVLVARQSWCTRQKTIKVGKMRESIILMQKP